MKGIGICEIVEIGFLGLQISTRIQNIIVLAFRWSLRTVSCTVAIKANCTPSRGLIE